MPETLSFTPSHGNPSAPGVHTLPRLSLGLSYDADPPSTKKGNRKDKSDVRHLLGCPKGTFRIYNWLGLEARVQAIRLVMLGVLLLCHIFTRRVSTTSGPAGDAGDVAAVSYVPFYIGLKSDVRRLLGGFLSSPFSGASKLACKRSIWSCNLSRRLLNNRIF